MLISTIAELRETRDSLPGTVGVVMTMGALHSGHLQLIAQAKRQYDHVIVTIFVNPLQFGVGEDFEKYPRTLDNDVRLIGDDAVLVFAPTAKEMYPTGKPQVTVKAGDIADRYEGAVRPGHFDGMLTVVHLLLQLTRPDGAFFGNKDAQQLCLIKAMVTDFHMPVEIKPVDIVRDADGVALSSRNAYLSAEERKSALALSRAGWSALSGTTPKGALRIATDVLSLEPGIELEYVDLVDAVTFQPVASEHHGQALLIMAARVGSTRLIDNFNLNF